jgi:transcriptional regulator with XRE-family HTH domain
MTEPQAPQRDPAWKQLGDRLRAKREYLGLSQQLVSDRTGIARSAISDIERGERKVDSLELKKLAALYLTPVTYLLDEDADADPAEHAIAALKRAVAGLTDSDQRELLRFAEFLRHRHSLMREQPE